MADHLDDADAQLSLLDLLNTGSDAEADDEPEPDVAGIVRTFSPASKRRLGRAIASVDWADVIKPGDRLALVTLTYPAAWQSCCPTPDAAYAHVRALAKRFARATGRPLSCVWKREFQRRGAPHFHLLAPLPSTILEEPVHRWLSRSWYEIVRSGDDRHLVAGTGIDWSEGLRMVDANRAAAYFTGYSAGKADAKAYQDEAPEGWCNDNGSIGRWWGTMALEAVRAEVRITPGNVVEAKRLLRGVLGAQNRTRTVRTRRIDRSTGEVSYRRSRRRYRLSSLRGGATAGCTFLTNDGPALAIALARALQLDQTEPWPKGQRRPLP